MNPRTFPRLLFALVLALGVLAATPPAADAEQMVLGRDGTIFRLAGGAYGTLFPDGGAAERDSPVLALEVTRRDGTAQQLLVPGTESRDPEGAYTLVFEDRSQIVYVLWESLFNGVHPLLYLTSFDGSEWSEVIEIANGPFARKGSPQLVVTRDRGVDAHDGEELAWERTILHLTWWEEGQSGSSKLYTPLVLENGVYQGRSPVLALGGFEFDKSATGGWVETAAGIEHALALRPGPDNHSAIVGFLDPETHRFRVLYFDVLPLALSDLADKARAEIILIGDKSLTLAEIAEEAREALFELGAAFHVATRTYIAERVSALIAEAGSTAAAGGITALADKARAEIILIGLRMGSNGLVRTDDGQVVVIGPAGENASRHLLGVYLVSDRPAPEVGGPATVILSRSGENVLVAWEEAAMTSRIYYRESDGEGWSEPSFIELGEGIDRAAAFRMLEERARDR